jgi:hypothetical protein
MHLDRDDDSCRRRRRAQAASSTRCAGGSVACASASRGAMHLHSISLAWTSQTHCRNGQARALPSLRELPAASHTMFETRSAKAIHVVRTSSICSATPFTLIPLPTHSRDPPLAPASMADAVVDVCLVCPAHAAPAAAQPWSQLTLLCSWAQ